MNLQVKKTELRDLNYPIYLCTSFAPLINQSLLQDLLSLFCHLTNAITQPSEQMLKAIRVQWWIDCITELKCQNSPLLDRIINHIHNNRLDKEKMLSILETFQNATTDDKTETALKVCWSAVFEYYCILTRNKETEIIRILGSFVSYIIYNPTKIEKIIKNSNLENELNVITSMKTQDGFINSCAYLLSLSKNKKLGNYKLLPIRLFCHSLLRR